jgi:hypothetical protein
MKEVVRDSEGSLKASETRCKNSAQVKSCSEFYPWSIMSVGNFWVLLRCTNLFSKLTWKGTYSLNSKKNSTISGGRFDATRQRSVAAAVERGKGPGKQFGQAHVASHAESQSGLRVCLCGVCLCLCVCVCGKQRGSPNDRFVETFCCMYENETKKICMQKNSKSVRRKKRRIMHETKQNF